MWNLAVGIFSVLTLAESSPKKESLKGKSLPIAETIAGLALRAFAAMAAYRAAPPGCVLVPLMFSTLSVETCPMNKMQLCERVGLGIF